jgi:hypothetical protein
MHRNLPALAVVVVLTVVLPSQASARTSISSTAAGGIAIEQQAPVPPPRPVEEPGSEATLTARGLALAPADAPQEIKAVIAAGNAIAKTPYKWGGGHARYRDSGYDCSGSVSFALRAAKLLRGSLNSSGFMSWGQRGRGAWITIRSNPGHAYMVVAGLRFDTSARSIGGSRWTDQMRSARGFRGTHPVGF